MDSCSGTILSKIVHISPHPFPQNNVIFFLVIRLHRPQRLHNIELGAGGIRDLTLDANRSGKKQTDDNFFYEKDDTFKFTIHVSVAQRPSSVESRIKLKLGDRNMYCKFRCK